MAGQAGRLGGWDTGQWAGMRPGTPWRINMHGWATSCNTGVQCGGASGGVHAWAQLAVCM